ncbi:unnamed protein product [Ranitomeya imitator]|uniref:Uncharacterized protein n=1 Tax=Ranitomeya imitator TaxID=111125 RepID=A0ABN9LHY0_9NEOB|nr:unnamed protein product [Ranitomeya imitator]
MRGRNSAPPDFNIESKGKDAKPLKVKIIKMDTDRSEKNDVASNASSLFNGLNQNRTPYVALKESCTSLDHQKSPSSIIPPISYNLTAISPHLTSSSNASSVSSHVIFRLWTYPFCAFYVCPAYQYELILSCWKLWEADLPSTPLVRCGDFCKPLCGFFVVFYTDRTVVNSVVEFPPVDVNGTLASSVYGLPLVALSEAAASEVPCTAGFHDFVLLAGSSGMQSGPSAPGDERGKMFVSSLKKNGGKPSPAYNSNISTLIGSDKTPLQLNKKKYEFSRAEMRLPEISYGHLPELKSTDVGSLYSVRSSKLVKKENKTMPESRIPSLALIDLHNASIALPQFVGNSAQDHTDVPEANFPPVEH